MDAPRVACAADPATAARSTLYLLFSRTFAFPGPLHEAVADGGLRDACARSAAALPYALPPPPASLADANVRTADLAEEYVRLFDVGVGGPPCPLYGGVYQGDRMRTMEEATRFYHFFGLRLAPPLRELPDHVTTELEFMHYLTFREVEAHERGADAGSLVRAERDFLARHLCRWMPRLAERLARQVAGPFYPALVGYCLAFVAAEEEYATKRAAEA